MTKQAIYKVQFSHDKQRWFDYGADAIKSGKEFGTIEEAEKIFDTLLNSYVGLLSFVRIIDKHTEEVIKSEKVIPIPIT